MQPPVQPQHRPPTPTQRLDPLPLGSGAMGVGRLAGPASFAQALARATCLAFPGCLSRQFWSMH